MATYFITRHPAAMEWAHRRGIEAEHVVHLECMQIQKGEIVMGTLPISSVACINERGA